MPERGHLERSDVPIESNSPQLHEVKLAVGHSPAQVVLRQKSSHGHDAAA